MFYAHNVRIRSPNEYRTNPSADLLLAEDQDGLHANRGRRKGSRDPASVAVVGVRKARNAGRLVGAFSYQDRSASHLQACGVDLQLIRPTCPSPFGQAYERSRRLGSQIAD